ncbi:hypothetical protein N328_12154, partial [Gavia stellata]
IAHSLQQDLFIYKSITQAQHEEKIEDQASNLCEYINNRLTDIEFFHKKKSKFYKATHNSYVMHDALAILRANTEKYYDINGEDTEGSPGKLKLLHNKLHEKKFVIEDLERKLQEYQEKGRAKMVFLLSLKMMTMKKKMLEKENEDFKEEVLKLHNEISRLENALKRSEKEKYLLGK